MIDGPSKFHRNDRSQGLKPAADAKHIQLVADRPASPIEVLADPKRLQQVLWNLLHNAIKFTLNEGRVEACIVRVGGEVQVTVQDTGRGITAAFLPHVFERFRQDDSSTTRETFGLGLGLSIAKHLVEMQGGTIAARSDGPGRGATFIVRFPSAGASEGSAALGAARVEADPGRAMSVPA